MTYGTPMPATQSEIMVSHDDPNASCRYFVSYSGVQLPLNLVQPLEPDGLRNRNTYFRAWYNSQGQLVTCQKIVYGEIEMEHRYEYRVDGRLASARIIDAEGEVTELGF